MSPRGRLLLAALALAGCGGGGETTGPYVVRVDLAPDIRAFGQETLLADEAAERVARIGPPAIPALAAALARESDADVRQHVVEVLAAIGTAEAVPPLVDAAGRDADDTVRGDALRALGTIGDPRATASLEAALVDPRAAVRGGGVAGCAALCTSPAAVDRLAAIAVDDREDPAVALAARGTLAAIRNRGPADAERVRVAIDRRRPAALPPEAGPDTRALAALLASEVDGAGATPALVGGLAAAPRLQRQIAWRLGEVGDARAADALRALLASPDPTVRLYAYDALVKLRARGVGQAGAAVAAYGGPRPQSPLPPPPS